MFWAEQSSDLNKHLKARDRKFFTTQPCSGRSDLALWLPVSGVPGPGGDVERLQERWILTSHLRAARGSVPLLEPS